MKNRISAWIILGIITIVAALSLAVTNEVTKVPIKQQSQLSEEKARAQVMPAAKSFEEIKLEDGQVLFAAKAGDEILGYIGKTERNGYGGPVEVIAGVLLDGTVSGVNVGGSSFAETPGLGAKARDAAFAAQFAGKTTPVRIGSSAEADAIDAITAATITSSAVVGGVNQIARQVALYLNPEIDKPEVITAEGTSYGATAEGFGGPVAVIVTVKDDGSISGLMIGDGEFSETDGYGAKALEPAFAEQFIGKTLPIALTDIEAISGATVTSTAVISAINQAFESKNVVEKSQPDGDTTYTASAEGFAGPVAVTLTVSMDGTIGALQIGDEQFSETEGYGAGALAPEFAAQFTGKTLPVSIEDIQAVSGATITTKAVIAAVNKAYESAAPEATKAADLSTEAPALLTEAPALSPEEPVIAPEGSVTISKDGFAGPVAVTVHFAGDGSIDYLAVGDAAFAETPGFGAAALEPAFRDQFIGKAPPLRVKGAGETAAGDTIDGITGATYTTKAVLAGINEAQAQLLPKPENTPEAIQSEAGEMVMAEMPGFMGPVAVALQFNADGSIAAITIGDDRFSETQGYGALALSVEYAAGFIGKTPPLTIRGKGEEASVSTVENITDPDSITSATRTAQAILDAVNEAGAQFALLQESKEGIEVTSEKEGFMGPITVSVSFNADGTIASVKIGDERFAESQGYGALALSEEFAAKLIGKLPPLTIRSEGEEISGSNIENLANPDTVTYATVTTQAIIDAVNDAYNKRP